jgi:hypothetical protein
MGRIVIFTEGHPSLRELLCPHPADRSLKYLQEMETCLEQEKGRRAFNQRSLWNPSEGCCCRVELFLARSAGMQPRAEKGV